MSEKEKKDPRIAELAAIVSVMVSILIASTTLLNNSGNLPSWWFGFSLIVLIALILFMPIMIFAKPVREKIKEARLGSKRDSISRKNASQFKDLVSRSRRFNYDIRNTMDSLRNNYVSDIKNQLAMSLLQNINLTAIDNITYDIEKEIDKSDKTFRDIYLIMKRLETVLDTQRENLRTIEVLAHYIMTSTEKPIAKGIEAEFEAFREKYNDFIKDTNDFYHNINQESESHDFPEHFEYVKKW